MRTWWYAEAKSTLEKYYAWPNLSSRLLMRGMGNTFRQVMAFNARKSTHICNLPVFFRMNNMGAPYGLTNGRIQPLANISTTYFYTSALSAPES